MAPGMRRNTGRVVAVTSFELKGPVVFVCRLKVMPVIELNGKTVRAPLGPSAKLAGAGAGDAFT